MKRWLSLHIDAAPIGVAVMIGIVTGESETINAMSRELVGA